MTAVFARYRLAVAHVARRGVENQPWARSRAGDEGRSLLARDAEGRRSRGYRDPDADPPALAVQVGATELRCPLPLDRRLHDSRRRATGWPSGTPTSRRRPRRDGQDGPLGSTGWRLGTDQEGPPRPVRQLRAARTGGARSRRGGAQRRATGWGPESAPHFPCRAADRRTTGPRLGAARRSPVVACLDSDHCLDRGRRTRAARWELVAAVNRQRTFAVRVTELSRPNGLGERDAAGLFPGVQTLLAPDAGHAARTSRSQPRCTAGRSPTAGPSPTWARHSRRSPNS